MTVKKDPKRQLLGKIAKARGKQFESRIDDSFAYYAQKGFAIIEKTPEPMHPTKNLGNGKFIAYYEKQAQPDYKGTIKGGRTVMFEAKFTAADRMEQSRVLQSQQDYMDRHQALGARCFVIAGFSSGMVYCVPWDIWKTMKDHFGRKYVTEAGSRFFRLPSRFTLIRVNVPRVLTLFPEGHGYASLSRACTWASNRLPSRPGSQPIGGGVSRPCLQHHSQYRHQTSLRPNSSSASPPAKFTSFSMGRSLHSPIRCPFGPYRP